MCNVQPEEETDSLRCFYKSNLLKNYELEPSDNIQAYCFAIMMSASSRHSCYISLFVYYKFVTVTLLLPLQVQADEFWREMLHPTFTHVKLFTWVKFECTYGEREIEHIYLKNSNSNIDETEFFTMSHALMMYASTRVTVKFVTLSHLLLPLYWRWCTAAVKMPFKKKIQFTGKRLPI